VNIQSTKRDVTVLFDGYNKDVRVPDSNAVRGEVCDSNVHQVYVRFTLPRILVVIDRLIIVACACLLFSGTSSLAAPYLTPTLSSNVTLG
jgi:hypothetical protein